MPPEAERSDKDDETSRSAHALRLVSYYIVFIKLRDLIIAEA